MNSPEIQMTWSWKTGSCVTLCHYFKCKLDLGRAVQRSLEKYMLSIYKLLNIITKQFSMLLPVYLKKRFPIYKDCYWKGLMFETMKFIRRILLSFPYTVGEPNVMRLFPPGLQLSDVWSQGCLHPIRNNQTSVSTPDHSLYNDSAATVTHKHMYTCTNTLCHTAQGLRFNNVHI